MPPPSIAGRGFFFARGDFGVCNEHFHTTDGCLFCKIAREELPSHAVYSNNRIHAFLDINPIRPGHVQIIPRDHHRYFDDLPPDLAAEIVHFGQRLAVAMKRLFHVQRVAFLFTGGDIPHAHAHVVPMVSPTDITSLRYIEAENIRFRSTPRMADDELAAIASSLRESAA
jgi:histidine triad (HIT) family protein